MIDDQAPQRTDAPIREIELTGAVLPWKDAQPVYLMMPRSSFFYVPVFSTATLLRIFMAASGLEFQSIKQIEDGLEFLSSFEERSDIRVIFDPYRLPNGRVRFSQIAHKNDLS